MTSPSAAVGGRFSARCWTGRSPVLARRSRERGSGLAGSPPLMAGIRCRATACSRRWPGCSAISVSCGARSAGTSPPARPARSWPGSRPPGEAASRATRQPLSATTPRSAASSVASPDSTGTLDATRLLARSRELLQQPVLVTGATGFVGANVTRALVDAGARVHVTLQASSSTWRLADVIGRVQTHVAGLTDTEALERTFEAVRPGVVLHLATPRVSHESARARFVEVTVLGAANLLRLSREFGVQRVVVTGSSLEYGPSDTPLTEDASLEPTTVHGVAKAAASLLWQQAARDRGMPVCVLRLFHVYGPWESRHRLLPSAIRAGLDGVPLPLTAGGGARDWVFVDDVVDAIVRAVGFESRGEIINVGSGREYSNDAVVACVA